MQACLTLPDHVAASFEPVVVRAAILAMDKFTPPSAIGLPDVKRYAGKIRAAGSTLNTKIVRNVALNAAAHILVGKTWHDVEQSLPRAPAARSISLAILGAQHKPQEMQVARVGEMADAAIEHILRLLSDSSGAVIDIERTP
jgi:hypothetical protein